MEEELQPTVATVETTEKIARIPGVTRKNLFRPGDIAQHKKHHFIGEVVKVHSNWVYVRIFGKTLPGGKPWIERFAYQKMAMAMTLEQRIEKAQQAQQELLRAQEAKTPKNRVAGWLRKYFKPKPATAVPAAA